MRPFTRLSTGLAAVALGIGALVVSSTPRVEASAALPASWNLDHTCTYCHDPHGGPNTANLHNEDVEVLCMTCHGPTGISVLKADVHEVDGYRFTCLDCHDKHKHLDNWLAGENLKTVGTADPVLGLARILTPNSGLREVVFESRGDDVGQPTLHSFADADEDGNGYYDGICETCHTTTKHHVNNPTGGHKHHVGETCTRCHEHADGFMKS